MDTKELIKQNNEKRELLHEPNKVYYEQVLMYIRSRLSLSEQKTEEILMDLLDHMLEAQANGKSAKVVFGENPKAYADDIIEQIPDEEKRDMVKFWGRIAFQLTGYYFIWRGIVMLILAQFTPVDDRLYVIPTLIQMALIAALVYSGVRLIFGWINKTAFEEVTKKGRLKEVIVAGTLGALGFGLIAGVNWLLPTIGPATSFPPASSIGVGAIFLLISWILKRTEWK
ncbi:DUF1129 family protein [Chryseomicrobium palamuruense]|uniref:DUF1129 family protein n=1 Tax=Chryseomicrobium palamuruense TaxID=682973 RepID=A0ABV8USZ8_9BACL